MSTMFASLLGETPSSGRLRSYLEEVASASGMAVPEADVKPYPDAAYFNYYTLGLSLLFTPVAPYKPSIKGPLEYGNLSLDSVDVFNPANGTPSSRGKTYSRFPFLPLAISGSSELAETDRIATQTCFELNAETTGKDLVQSLGEPTRKGGGAGPSSGSIGIWCEWAKHGIMVEFGGDEARGPQAWERGKDAVWKVLTVFKPKDA